MSKRALIADDSPVVQRAMGFLVESLGFQVDLASTGWEAVQAVGKQQYAVVLMDLRMPGMDGLAATRTIRETGNKVPIVGFTSNPMRDDAQKSVQAGMSDFLDKPLDKSTVQKVFARCIESPAETG
jgi:two-component system, sensor histidine kinase and response regulator